MYKTPKMKKTKAPKINASVNGETIEQKIERIVNNKEPVGQGNDSAPIIYTERREGVRASTNIRTDRFEIAVEAADKIARSYKARREERAKAKEKALEDKNKEAGNQPIGEPKSIQGAAPKV